MGDRSLSLLSVVAPMCNEQATVERFYEQVTAALAGVPFELVIVEDGSSDATLPALKRIAATDPRVAVVALSRNFGHQAALTAGLEHARGDVVVMLDGDLQDPPQLIPRMLDEWRAGADVVYGVRRQRAGETRFKLRSARWFYRLFGRLAQIELQPDAGDFRLLDRRPLDALLTMPERSRFLRGMTVWVGFRQSAVPYEREARDAGDSKYTLGRMIRFALDAIVSFSHAPLQLATLLGFVFAGLAFLGLPFVLAARIAGIYVPGVSSILFVVLMLGGIQLITLGIVGEYVARVYDEVKRRPLFLVRERVNVAEPVERAAREPIET